MLAQFGAEGPQGAADQADGAAGMSAAAAAVDLAEPPAQQAEVGGAALRDPFEFAGHRGQAEPARAALARRLVGQVADDPGGLGEPAGAGGQRGDQPGAGSGAEIAEPGGGERPASACAAPTQVPK